MNDFFQKAEDFIAAAEAKTADAMTKGADALEGFAAYLRAQAQGIRQASPEDANKAGELLARCTECCPALASGDSAAPVRQAGGLWLGLAMQLLTKILQELAKQP